MCFFYFAHLKKEKNSFFFLNNFLKDEVSWTEWKQTLNSVLVDSQHTYTVTEKASKIYGADVKRITVQD